MWGVSSHMLAVCTQGLVPPAHLEYSAHSRTLSPHLEGLAPLSPHLEGLAHLGCKPMTFYV